MLRRMRLENFKAWKKADLRFGKVTGLFGANSAGKSSLLQFLLLLKRTRNATDRGLVLDFGGATDMVNLGVFENVVHQHDVEERIRWTLEWMLPERLKIHEAGEAPSGLSLEGRRVRTKSEVGLRGTRNRQSVLWPYSLRYRFGGVEFRLQRPGGKFQLDSAGGDFEFQRARGRPTSVAHPVKAHLFPNDVKSQFQNTSFLGDLELAYEKLMDSIYYLGPLREYPKRDYRWGGSSPQDVGPRGERTVDAILAATRSGWSENLRPKARYKSFQGMIAHWLKDLGLIERFDIRPIEGDPSLFRADVRTFGSVVGTALTDVGFGVSQVLPALVLLYYVPHGAIVLMEQPEIHLHPRVQSGLADVMLRVAKARNVQVIVESHSEHLLRRLQRRVAEEDATAEDVKLYFASTRDGVASLSDLELNEYGEVQNWPSEFFGDELGEMAAIAKAGLKRRIEAEI